MNTQQNVASARLWADYYAQVQAQRTLVRLAAERALDELKARLRPVKLDGAVAWRVLPLGDDDAASLRAISHAVTMAPVGAAEREIVGQLEDAVPEALADLAAVTGARRFVAGGAAKEAAADATEFLAEYVEWGNAEGIVATIKSLEPGPAPDDVAVADVLSPRVGLAAVWRKHGTAELVAAPATVGTSPAAADVVALRDALTATAPTHLVVFCAADRTAAGLLAVLAA